jgi:hypothetical protein
MRKLLGSLIALVLLSAMGHAQYVAFTGPGTSFAGPEFVFQHISEAVNNSNSADSGKTFNISTESLPANTTAVMAVTAPTAVGAISMSDTLVGSWSAAQCTASTTGGNEVAIFVQSLGATGGPDTLTVNIGATEEQYVTFDVTFFGNLGTADGSLCASNSGAGITPTSGGVVSGGSFTPSTNNNANGGHIIWAYVAPSPTVALIPTGWTPATGYAMLHGDTTNGGFPAQVNFPVGSQWLYQPINASTTPSFTIGGESSSTGDVYNLAAVAVKINNNGSTPPSTIHVANILHMGAKGPNAAGSISVYTPVVGNLRVLSTTWPAGAPGGAGVTLSGVSSSDGCTFTHEAGTSGGADAWYAQNCNPNQNLTLSLTFSGTGFPPPTWSLRFFDVENAAVSSFQSQVSNSSACAAGANNDMPTITPSISAGLTIAANGFGTGPVTGLASGSPSNSNFDLWTYTGQTDADQADNGDGVAHAYFSTNATQNWNWTGSVTSTCYWQADIFK